MALLPDYAPAVIPAPKKFADSLMLEFDRELQRRIRLHKDMFRRFWNTPGVQPQAIFDALGVHAALWLRFGQKDLADIASSLSLSGQSLSDYIQPDEYSAPYVLIVNADGTVTVGDPVV